MRFWKHWKYKNLTLVFVGLVFTFFLARFEPFHEFLLHLGTFGYFGAFLAGMLFVSTFTVGTGALILLILIEQYTPIEMALIAGLGGVVGDLIIFKFVKDDLTKELDTLYTQIDSKHHFIKLLHTKYFRWSLPVIGAIIIASPFPDELGVTLMGISKMSTPKFMVIAFLLDTLCIFLIATAALAFKITP